MIKYCHRHHRSYDGDVMTACPACEAQDVIIIKRRHGWAARWGADDPDDGRTIYGIGPTEDQAIDHLLEYA